MSFIMANAIPELELEYEQRLFNDDDIDSEEEK